MSEEISETSSMKMTDVLIVPDTDNESDEELVANRHESNLLGEPYDADMWFSVFLGNTCIRCSFNLYGLDQHVTFSPTMTEKDRLNIFTAMEIIVRWFNGKTLDDICEALYHRVEIELRDEIKTELERLVAKEEHT